MLDAQLARLLLHHELPDVREVGAAQRLEEVRVGAAQDAVLDLVGNRVRVRVRVRVGLGLGLG